MRTLDCRVLLLTPMLLMAPQHLAIAAERSGGLAAQSPAIFKPTAETLEQWLTGKEVVEVCFAGPHMEPQELKKSLRAKGLDNILDETFLLTPGEGGGDKRSFVTVVMNVTPENIQRLQSLQNELAPRKYPLDPEHTQAWSFQRTPATHLQVRDQGPRFLREVTVKITKAMPGAIVREVKPRASEYSGGVKYTVPGTRLSGSIEVYPITPHKFWDLPTQPDQSFHLPHLGLMIVAYYRPQQVGAEDDPSPEHAKIRNAVTQAMESLKSLEVAAKERP